MVATRARPDPPGAGSEAGSEDAGVQPLSRNDAPDDPFDNILNFRDVGRTVNTFLGRKLVRESFLYRSARPDDASPRDLRRLRDDFGVRTIIDLRSATEQRRRLQQQQERARRPGLGEEATEGAEDGGGEGAGEVAGGQPWGIPGVRRLEVGVTGRRFERFLLSQLGWLSFFKFLFLFLLGYRMPAVAILGREVMLPRGLLGLARDTLDNSGPEIAEALRALTAPALVHCTQGKDRTGLVVAVALLALGGAVPAAAAEHDYRLTTAQLAREEPPPARAARLAEIRELGLPASFGDTAPGFVDALAAHLARRHGGLDAYLDRSGFGPAERAALRERLLY